jgi:hypothetical protein
MNAIRFVFSAWYFVVGVALLWQGWRLPSTFAWTSALALLAFVASWQGFMNGGRLWRIMQRGFGVVTLLLFLLCSAMAVAYLTGLLKAGSGIGGLIVYVVVVAARALAVEGCEKMVKSGRDEKDEPVCAERMDWPPTFVRPGTSAKR